MPSSAHSSSYSSDGVAIPSSARPYADHVETNDADASPFTPASPPMADYTDGASAADMAEAIQIRSRGRGRSDSMSGWGGEEEGQFTFSSSSSLSCPCPPPAVSGEDRACSLIYLPELQF